MPRFNLRTRQGRIRWRRRLWRLLADQGETPPEPVTQTVLFSVTQGHLPYNLDENGQILKPAHTLTLTTEGQTNAPMIDTTSSPFRDGTVGQIHGTYFDNTVDVAIDDGTNDVTQPIVQAP